MVKSSYLDTRDIISILNRIEDKMDEKLDKMDERIGKLEGLGNKLMGIASISSVVFSAVFAWAWERVVRRS